MSSYWRYHNLSLFSYGKAESTGPADENQVLRDWQRWSDSVEQCPIYINGELLTTLAKKSSFTNATKLANFFKTHLFSDSDYSEEDKDQLAALALQHLHQAGLPFATYYCIAKTNTGATRLPSVMSRIDFNVTKQGLLITEQETYKKLNCAGETFIITEPNEYYAQTTTSTLMNLQGITLKSLDIDCPSYRAAAIFDHRQLWEKICQYIKNALIDYGWIENDDSVTPVSVMSF